jgi:hypothetical protein
MEIDCCAYLGDPDYSDDERGLWTDMVVARAKGTEWLITGDAQARATDAPAVATELTRIWNDRLRYNYRSAYTIEHDPAATTLLAVTQIGPDSLWVTIKICVRHSGRHE